MNQNESFFQHQSITDCRVSYGEVLTPDEQKELDEKYPEVEEGKAKKVIRQLQLMEQDSLKEAALIESKRRGSGEAQQLRVQAKAYGTAMSLVLIHLG